MKNPFLIAMGLSMAVLGCLHVHGDTLNVPNQYQTIQQAVDAASDGDIIKIAQGIYKEHKIEITGKSIRVEGTRVNGNLVTTVDGERNGGVFILQHPGIHIKDLIITGGDAGNPGGGGILCRNSNATIDGCHIHGNRAPTHKGGGIFCDNESEAIITTIKNCQISHNSSGYGGGINCRKSSAIIKNCIINNNNATQFGGGVRCYEQSNAQIINCQITSNLAGNDGGGVFSGLESKPTIIGGSVSGNQPDNIVSKVQELSIEGPLTGYITIQDVTICGTGSHVSGAVIHNGENHISRCLEEGDIDNDGDVDTDDLNDLHQALGICTSDIDHDGIVNIEDLLHVIEDWGTICP